MVKIAAWITELIEKSGYELESIDHPQIGDLIAMFSDSDGQNICRITGAGSSCHLAFIVTKKVTYRPVEAPRDLGKECEFSNTKEFQGGHVFYGRLSSITVGEDGKIGYARRFYECVTSFRFARIKDE